MCEMFLMIFAAESPFPDNYLKLILFIVFPRLMNKINMLKVTARLTFQVVRCEGHAERCICTSWTVLSTARVPKRPYSCKAKTDQLVYALLIKCFVSGVSHQNPLI